MKLIGEVKNEKVRDLFERVFGEATITVGKGNSWIKVDIPHYTADEKNYTKSYIIAIRRVYPYDTLTIGSLEECYRLDAKDLSALTEFYNGWRKINRAFSDNRLFWALNDDEWLDFAQTFEDYPDDDNPYLWRKKK